MISISRDKYFHGAQKVWMREKEGGKRNFLCISDFDPNAEHWANVLNVIVVDDGEDIGFGGFLNDYDDGRQRHWHMGDVPRKPDAYRHTQLSRTHTHTRSREMHTNTRDAPSYAEAER